MSEMKVKEIYEEFTFPLTGNHGNLMGKYIFPNLHYVPRRVLDAGCGTGNMTVELARNFPAARVVGVDFSENSLKYARLLAEKHRLTNIEFQYHDLMNKLSTEDAEQTYDLVLSLGCLHHTPDPRLCLRHLREVTQDGGLLIMLVYGKYGRIETEIRRTLMVFLRETTGRNNRELLSLCMELLDEEIISINTFTKQTRFSLSSACYKAFRDPVNLIRTVCNIALRRIGINQRAQGVRHDIGMADQYLHPLVHNWPVGQWIAAIRSAGFEVERFIYDTQDGWWCIPRNALERIKSRRVRSLLAEMGRYEQYETLDLIFRPKFHIIACKPV